MRNKMKEINLTVKRMGIINDISKKCFVNKNYSKEDVEYLKTHNVIMYDKKWQLTKFGKKVVEIIEEKDIYGGD